MGGVSDILDGKCPLLRVERAAESRRCVVVFSHLDYPPGRFAMSRALAGFETNVVFVNCPDNSWYQTGLGDWSASIAATAALLADLLDRIGATDVLSVGMSMGGYAAILFGLLLRVRGVLAFTPELLLGQPHGRSFALNRQRVYDHRYYSLAELMRANQTTALAIVYGAYDLIDLSLIWPAADVVGNHRLCAPAFVGGDHKVTLRLEPRALVETLLRKGALAPGDLEGDLTVLAPPSHDELLAYPLIQKYQAAKEPRKAYDLIAAIGGERSPQMELFLATACADLDRLAEGLAAVERAIAADPRGYALRHMAGLLCQRLGRLDEAEAAYATAVAIRPEATISVFRRATALASLGRTEEAARLFGDVVAKEPGHAEAAARLEALRAL